MNPLETAFRARHRFNRRPPGGRRSVTAKGRGYAEVAVAKGHEIDSFGLSRKVKSLIWAVDPEASKRGRIASAAEQVEVEFDTENRRECRVSVVSDAVGRVQA